MAVITVKTEPIVNPEAPTATFYDEVAGDLLPVLDQVLGVIPHIELAESMPASQFRATQFVSDAFCADAIDAVEEHAELQVAKKLDPVQSRVKLQFLVAFRPLEHKLNHVARRVTLALRAVKAGLALESLEVYRVSQSLAKDGSNPGIQSHVERMKRDLGRRSATKAERQQRAAERFNAAVEKEVAKRLDEAVALKLKEVKAAA